MYSFFAPFERPISWILIDLIILPVHFQITLLMLGAPLMRKHSGLCIHSLLFYYIWRCIWRHLVDICGHLSKLLLSIMLILLVTHLEYENQVLYNLLLLLLILLLQMLLLSSIQVCSLGNSKSTLSLPTFVLNVLSIFLNPWVIRMRLSIRSWL